MFTLLDQSKQTGLLESRSLRATNLFLKDAEIVFLQMTVRIIRGISSIQVYNPILVVAYPQMHLLTLKKQDVGSLTLDP